MPRFSLGKRVEITSSIAEAVTCVQLAKLLHEHRRFSGDSVSSISLIRRAPRAAVLTEAVSKGARLEERAMRELHERGVKLSLSSSVILDYNLRRYMGVFAASEFRVDSVEENCMAVTSLPASFYGDALDKTDIPHYCTVVALESEVSEMIAYAAIDDMAPDRLIETDWFGLEDFTPELFPELVALDMMETGG